MKNKLNTFISGLTTLALVGLLVPVSLVFATPLEIFNDRVVSVSEARFVPDELVVKYKNDNKPFRIVRLPRGSDVGNVVSIYSRNPNVEFAEPNYIATKYSVPNDPFYSLQWNFDNSVNGGVHAETAWDISTGNGVTIAIVDTGIAYENYNAGRGEKYYRAPDFAGTCFVDGYDFINNDTHANDDDSHGTHVAGTVAQRTNNNTGVAGLAYSACLMPVKVLDRNGNGSYVNVADGIYFAVDNGADVINLSLGGPTPGQVIEDAVAYAYANGVIVIAATGNDDGAVGYPAAYDDYVIAVGATIYDEQRASYSNFGPSVDVVAPGGDLSLDQNGDGYGDGILQNTFNPNTKRTNDFGYWFFSGTSMATPHVAAIAALVIANGNATTPDDVRAALESTADDLGNVGHDDLYGWGLVNASAALGWASGPVDNAPTVSVTSPIDGVTVVGSITITVNATDDNGVTQVDFYIDGVLLGTDTTAPYEMLWDSTTVGDGLRTISVTAVDTVSQTANDSVNVTVDNVNDPPIAHAGSDQTLSDDDDNGSELVFLDGSGSSDPDGSIVLYEWYEGATPLASSTSSSTAIVTLAIGAHSITLVVTDNDGATGNDTVLISIVESLPTPDITLSGIGYKVKGRQKVDLTWSGANSTNVDVYRDGAIVVTTVNDGFYIDNINQRGNGSYLYQICEEGNTTCSNEYTVIFN